jgi:hypothetical protein
VALTDVCEYTDRNLLRYIYPPNNISKHPPVNLQDFHIINSESHQAPEKPSGIKVNGTE